MYYAKELITATAVALTVFISTANPAEARPRIANQSFERSEGKARSDVRITTRRGEASRTVTRSGNRDTRTANASASVTGAQGRTATYNRNIQGRDNGYDAKATYTDFQGRTATRSQSVTRGEGSISRDYDATFRVGGAASAYASASRTDDGFASSRGFETSNGRGGEVSSTGTRFDDGGGNITRNVTDAQGETVATKSTTIEDGARTTVFTDRNGNTQTVITDYDN